jgi:predicted O-methyltransferase YrrM
MMQPWWKPSSSQDVQPVPWLSPEATQYLENLLQPGFEVLEHGSGGSTLWFAGRVKKIVSIESNSDWREAVRRQAPANAIVILNNWPGVPDNWREWAPYDLLLIDGEPVDDRRDWLLQAKHMVKPGGWIVLDNANRAEYATERAALAGFADLVITIDGNDTTGKTQTKYLVTDFWQIHWEEKPSGRKKRKS